MTLVHHLAVRTPLIWCTGDEPRRVIAQVTATSDRPVYRMDFVDGLVKWDAAAAAWKIVLLDTGEIDEAGHPVLAATHNIQAGMLHVFSQREVMIVENTHALLEVPGSPLISFFQHVGRAYTEAAYADDADRVPATFVLISYKDDVVPELLRDVVKTAYELPGTEELSTIIAHVSARSHAPVDANLSARLVKAGQGMGEFEFIHALFSSLKTHKALDPDFVNARKVAALQAGGVLQVREPKLSMDQLGGMDQLKELMHRATYIWEHPVEAAEFEIEPIRKILLVGVPGSGKSAVCEATAQALGLTLVVFGASKMMSKWVGESLPYEETIFTFIDGQPTRIAIGDLVEHHSERHVEVWSSTPDGGSVIAPVTGFLRHEGPDYIDVITTQSGRRVSVTGGHSLFVRENDKLKEVIADEIQPGVTRVAVPLRLTAPESIETLHLIPAFAHRTDIFVQRADGTPLGKRPVSVRDFCQYLYDGHPSTWRDEYGDADLSLYSYRQNKFIPAVFPLTEDIGEFLGMWAANGRYLDNHAIGLSLNNADVAHYLPLCESLFGHVTVAPAPGKESTDLVIGHRIFQHLMQDVIGLQTGSHNKRVPAIIFAAPLPVIAAFLRGYFDGDGSFTDNVESSSVSEQLTEGIATLLQYFGIVASLSQRTLSSGSIDYRLRFGWTKFLKQFQAHIGFTRECDNHKLQMHLDGIKLQRWLQTPGPHIVNDVVWELVVSKERQHYAHPHVYDISVEATENFTAGYGNVLVHNSEQNMRRAFKQVAAMEPVVLWVDEFGRDMSGSGQSNDSGTTDRVHGEMLTGIQELGPGVFLMGAANRIDGLPPEMLRAGRFDKIVFVGFPTAAERQEIFRIHLGRAAHLHDLEALATATPFFTGAEIQALIKEVRFRIIGDYHRAPTTEDLARFAPRMKGLVWNNHRAQVLDMYRRAQAEWDWASSGQEQEAPAIVKGDTPHATPKADAPASPDIDKWFQQALGRGRDVA